MPVNALHFWKVILSQKAPTLLTIFSIVMFNDKRKKTAIMSAHHPGFCMAVAIQNGIENCVGLLFFSYYTLHMLISRLALSKVTLCIQLGVLRFESRWTMYELHSHLLEVSKLHTTLLLQWICDDKFWGDNVDKKRGFRYVGSDHHGPLLYMYMYSSGQYKLDVLST